MTPADVHLRKAVECLLGARSELEQRRFNNTASRSYYACYHAALSALLHDGIKPPFGAKWSHKSVNAAFSGDLIGRRKRLPAELRDTLPKGADIRLTADDELEDVSEVQAVRNYRRADALIRAVAALRRVPVPQLESHR